jgi:hypothetical protein
MHIMTDARPLDPQIETFISAVPDPESARALRALCEVIVLAEPRLVSVIKWNAPSFTLDGQDVVTTGINRNGGVRLVLHRGAAKAAPGTTRPVIEDPEQMLDWRGADRAMLTVESAEAVTAASREITSFVRQWASLPPVTAPSQR